jgi:PKD repeat protein
LARGSALALIAVTAGPASTAVAAPPAASFLWFPPTPALGEQVTFASTSTDASSPITGFAWDLAGSGTFAGGGPVAGTTFTTAGEHVVALRVTNAEGLSALVSETVRVTAPALALMEPFPVVRFVGSESSSGVRLRLLSVEAPSGARITVACRGRGCPVKAESRVAPSSGPETVTVTFSRFERRLPAGVVLEVRVTKSGDIGKYTRLVIRRGKPPARVDKCVEQTAAAPIACHP